MLKCSVYVPFKARCQFDVVRELTLIADILKHSHYLTHVKSDNPSSYGLSFSHCHSFSLTTVLLVNHRCLTM